MLMDEDSIKELVEILLDNAIKHSKKKGTINLSLKKDIIIYSAKSLAL